jgi:hypothetical protein
MEWINLYSIVMKMEIKINHQPLFCRERGDWNPVSRYRGMASSRKKKQGSWRKMFIISVNAAS